ncbi:hypothetical protein HYH03_007681 [Edaphochlamys debaryana]|uniref:GATA-type domain-containing protein n=1 Tax=Edaphochlamys debaryana TaxID=47281 RepID=A0A836C030_9CHLO|nr:hypothetical protein HYH03_007681 [Edaphochlamys debaryana]|eukprot:KAG2494034.1 hypothetical protein HYH03_007681 [Edaphochlamys debaryana]
MTDIRDDARFTEVEVPPSPPPQSWAATGPSAYASVPPGLPIRGGSGGGGGGDGRSLAAGTTGGRTGPSALRLELWRPGDAEDLLRQLHRIADRLAEHGDPRNGLDAGPRFRPALAAGPSGGAAAGRRGRDGEQGERERERDQGEGAGGSRQPREPRPYFFRLQQRLAATAAATAGTAGLPRVAHRFEAAPGASATGAAASAAAGAATAGHRPAGAAAAGPAGLIPAPDSTTTAFAARRRVYELGVWAMGVTVPPPGRGGGSRGAPMAPASVAPAAGGSEVAAAASAAALRQPARREQLEAWIWRELAALLQRTDLTLLRGLTWGLVEVHGLERDWREPEEWSRGRDPQPGPGPGGAASAAAAVADAGAAGAAGPAAPVGGDSAGGVRHGAGGAGGGGGGPVEALRPFLFEHAGHFWHELRCYALSGLSLPAYDACVREGQLRIVLAPPGDGDGGIAGDGGTGDGAAVAVPGPAVLLTSSDGGASAGQPGADSAARPEPLGRAAPGILGGGTGRAAPEGSTSVELQDSEGSEDDVVEVPLVREVVDLTLLASSPEPSPGRRPQGCGPGPTRRRSLHPARGPSPPLSPRKDRSPGSAAASKATAPSAAPMAGAGAVLTCPLHVTRSPPRSRRGWRRQRGGVGGSPSARRSRGQSPRLLWHENRVVGRRAGLQAVLLRRSSLVRHESRGLAEGPRRGEGAAGMSVRARRGVTLRQRRLGRPSGRWPSGSWRRMGTATAEDAGTGPAAVAVAAGVPSERVGGTGAGSGSESVGVAGVEAEASRGSGSGTGAGAGAVFVSRSSSGAGAESDSATPGAARAEGWQRHQRRSKYHKVYRGGYTMTHELASWPLQHEAVIGPDGKPTLQLVASAYTSATDPAERASLLAALLASLEGLQAKAVPPRSEAATEAAAPAATDVQLPPVDVSAAQLRHSALTGPCAVPGCPYPLLNKGQWYRGPDGECLCGTCRSRWYNNGCPAEVPRPLYLSVMTGPCAVPGCPYPLLNKGAWNRGPDGETLCHTCYQRWRKNDYPAKVPPPRSVTTMTGPCAVPGCPYPLINKGCWLRGPDGETLCHTCYNRWHRHDHPAEVPPPPPRVLAGPCAVPGCGKVHPGGKGRWRRGPDGETLCHACYKRWCKWECPAQVPPPRGRGWRRGQGRHGARS